MNEGMLAILLIFGIPVLAILTAHHRKVLEIKHRSRQDAGEQRAIEELRAEIASLRDTTTRFDLSFDTALQNLESRVAHLEARLRQAASEEVHTGQGT